MLIESDLSAERRGRYRDRQGGGRTLDEAEALDAVRKGHEVTPFDRETAEDLAQRLDGGDKTRAEMLRRWIQREFGSDRDARLMDTSGGLNAPPPDDRDPGLPTSSFPGRPQPGVSRREPDDEARATEAARPADELEPVTERTESSDKKGADAAATDNTTEPPDVRRDAGTVPPDGGNGPRPPDKPTPGQPQGAGNEVRARGENRAPDGTDAGSEGARAKAMVEAAGDDMAKLTDLARRAGLKPAPKTQPDALRESIKSAVALNIAKGQPGLKD